jgi:hypothetical protein
MPSKKPLPRIRIGSVWSRLQSARRRLLSRLGGRGRGWRGAAVESADSSARARHIVLGTPNHDAPKTVVILGLPRGGTSMVAGVVRELGIDLGPRLGVNHEDPHFLPTDLDVIRRRIRERNAQDQTWGWKMPHSTDYIDRIETDLRNPHVIFVFRNILGVALSQERHSAAELDIALDFSLQKMGTMLSKIGKLSCPKLLIDYDSAVRAKEDFVSTLSSFLGLEPDSAEVTRALAFIDPAQGYRQIAANYYLVSRVDAPGMGAEVRAARKDRHLRKSEDGKAFLLNGSNPGFVFTPAGAEHLPARIVFSFNNVTGVARDARFLFDYDGHFSRNMSQIVSATPGQNHFLVETNGEARRICIIPEMVDDKSSIMLFSLTSPD